MRNNVKMVAVLLFIMISTVFCGSATADETKEFVPGKDTGFYYTIQKGDTLWDLSRKFYHSQWDWPGLWELNPDIKNPHWLEPGRKIRIFLKEAALPQTPRFNAAKDVVPSFSYSEMDRVAFIRTSAEPSLGSVIREQDSRLMASANDIIYIKPSDRGTLIPGEMYHVFKTQIIEKQIENRPFKGVLHNILAQIRIIDHKVRYVTAQITKAYSPVQEGDMIMAFREREPQLTVEENPEPVQANLVCSDEGHLMINDRRIAFIDLGGDHVRPGQIYSIMRSEARSSEKPLPWEKDTQMEFEKIESGRLIVLHTEDIASTVVILSSKYAIHPEDVVR